MLQKSGFHQLRLVDFIPLFTGFYKYQVVQEFFHQQYLPFIRIAWQSVFFWFDQFHGDLKVDFSIAIWTYTTYTYITKGQTLTILSEANLAISFCESKMITVYTPENEHVP